MARPNTNAPLGQGGRFASLKNKLGKQKGVTNPGALAAFIGRQKYGPAKFNSLMPKGGTLSPHGDIGALRQAEADKVGRFKGDGPIVKTEGKFNTITSFKAAK